MNTSFPISIKERQRRLKIVRGKMEEKGLDALLVTGSASQTDKGNIRYLSNFLIYTRYVHMLLPLEGDPKLFVLWPSHKSWGDQTSWIENVQLSAPTPKVTSDIVTDLKQLSCEEGNIGLAGMEIVPAPFYLDLKNRLPKAKLESATTILLEAREVKSVEEQRLVKKSVEIADKVFDELPSIMKAGRTHAEIFGEIESIVRREGSEDSLISWWGPIGSNRVLKVGDVFHISIEPQVPGGYFQQKNRMVSMGKPPKGLSELLETVERAKDAAAEDLIPGNTGRDVAQAASDVFEKELGKKVTVCGHGIALDLVEKPLLDLDDKTIIKEGMIVVIHPGITVGNNTAVLGDTYIVTKDKPQCLNRTKEKLFIL